MSWPRLRHSSSISTKKVCYRAVEKTTLGILALGIVLGFSLSYIMSMTDIRYHIDEARGSFFNWTDTKTAVEFKDISTQGFMHETYTTVPDGETFHEVSSSAGRTEAAVEEAVEEAVDEAAVRVLCWVMTNPENHEKKAKHVKATWGRRCDTLLFMSSTDDPVLGTVKLDVLEGREHLWDKTKAAFKYIHAHHRHDADWFIKTDDDTYVVVENLRYMLSTHNNSEPVYFGCKFKPIVKQGYMSGGAGYVLSQQALDLLVEQGLNKGSSCEQGFPGGIEDASLGLCMEQVGVTAGDSRDSQQRGRFFPFSPEQHLIPGDVPGGVIDKTFWYWDYIYYDIKPGFECCSDVAISFHYISPNTMYLMEYLIYILHPHGLLS